MKHIFISYKKPEDGDFADLVANRIEKAGFSPWIDNDRLQVGKDWRIGIDQAIKESCALIIIMSPDARASEYVTYEWAYALGAEINVIPILYKKTELHPRLEALQYLDFTNFNHRPWDELIRAVSTATSKQDTPRYIKQAIDAINNVNTYDREGAINTLADAKYSEVLIEALSHPFQDVRSNASRALGKIKEEFAVPSLIAALHDQSADVRSSAAWALGAIGDSRAVPDLLQSMFDSSEEVRYNSIWALGEIQDVRAVPSLIEALHDQNEEICRKAAQALGEIKEAVPTLLETLRDPSTRVQHHVRQALVKITEARPSLLEALRDPDARVRSNVCLVLGALKDEASVPNLLEVLNDLDAKVRRNCSLALGEIKSPLAIPGLIKAVNDSDFAVRLNSIKALGAMKAVEAIPVIFEATKDPNEDLQKVAQRALKRINKF
jgi:HEAT repeat protein